MKRRFFSVFVFTLFAGLFVLLSSCSGLLRDTGSATFSISPEVLKTAIENASKGRINQNSFILSNEDDLDKEKEEYPDYEDYEDEPKEDFFDSEKVELKVSLTGKYQKTITNVYTMEEMEAMYGGNDDSETVKPIQITFPDIPLGYTVTAEASIAFIFAREEIQEKQMYYMGTSDPTKIVAGNNPLTVVLKECHPYLIKIYVEDETATNTDVEGYRYDYYQKGTFNNYDNFEEDFYKHIMAIKESESERYKDYEYDDFDCSFDEDGTEVYKVFFTKKKPLMIYYEVYPYYQNENTTYDDNKSLEDQESIFTTRYLMASGEVSEEKWEGDLKNVIVPKASLNVAEGYTYCGYLLEEEGETSYIIKVFFKSTKIEEPVKPVLIGYTVSIYNQKENTTYDETKTPDAQEEIFEFYDDAEYGDATEEEWKEKLEEDILVRAKSNSDDDYIYCGYTLVEDGDYDYIVKVYYKAVEKEPEEPVDPVDVTATVKFNISLVLPYDIQEEQEDNPENESEDEDPYESQSFKVIVTLTGNDDYAATKEQEFTEKELKSASGYITFEEVPVGKIAADAILYISYIEYDGEYYTAATKPIYKSEKAAEVSAGINTIQLPLESYEQEVTSYILQYYFADEKAYDSDYPGYIVNESYEERGTCKNAEDFNSKLNEVAEEAPDGYQVNKKRNVYEVSADGLCIFKLFLDKVKTIDYTISYYKQKKDTKYNKELLPETQSDIFELDRVAKTGSVVEDELSDFDDKILASYTSVEQEGYRYCGNSTNENDDGSLDIIIYFRLVEIIVEEPEQTTAGFSIVLEKVVTDDPVDLEITDSSTENQILLTTDQGYASYKWFVNNKSYEPNPNGYEIKFDLTERELSPGVYYVNVTVTDSNGALWTSDDYKLIVQY